MASETLGSVLDRRRWRVAIVLGGVGDAVQGLLPLFALVSLDQSVTAAAAVGAAYVGGELAGNLMLWGRLADRVRSPRALVIVGTAVQGAALVGVAAFPEIAGIVALAALLGVAAVSMDGAIMRLAVGDLVTGAQGRAVLQYADLLQRGLVLGLLLAAVATPLLGLAVDAGDALRVVVGAIGGAVLTESALVATTIGRRRSAPELTATVSDLAASGVVVLWAGSGGPAMRALRITRQVARRGPERLSDTLRLLLMILVVMFFGFAMHGGVFALYLRTEGDLDDGPVLVALMLGALVTSLTIPRASVWLQTIPAVQAQTVAGAVRVVLYAGFALLALEAAAAWSLVGVGVLYLLSQTAFGIVVPANVARVAQLAPESRRGEVTGYASAAVALGVILGTTTAGLVADSAGFPVVFGIAAGATLVSSILLLRW